MKHQNSSYFYDGCTPALLLVDMRRRWVVTAACAVRLHSVPERDSNPERSDNASDQPYTDLPDLSPMTEVWTGPVEVNRSAVDERSVDGVCSNFREQKRVARARVAVPMADGSE